MSGIHEPMLIAASLMSGGEGATLDDRIFARFSHILPEVKPFTQDVTQASTFARALLSEVEGQFSYAHNEVVPGQHTLHVDWKNNDGSISGRGEPVTITRDVKLSTAAIICHLALYLHMHAKQFKGKQVTFTYIYEPKL